MTELYTMYMLKKFQYFSHPKKSRFTDIIKSEKLIEIQIKKATKYHVNIKKINSGEEKRTTLVIKGFPSTMEISEVEGILRQFTKNIDYFFIPVEVKENEDFMYCFVNVIDPNSVVAIYCGLVKLRTKYSNHYKYDFSHLKVEYSKLQGLKKLLLKEKLRK